MIQSQELRSRFLKYFASKGHTIVPSSPLLPKDDPTLLFINAGMAQFKDVFTGKEKRAYTRATSSQKCVRAGGKHNDLENVGRTARHHTFFEMLGNFSFGDYFKEDACKYAWEFLTKDVGLDPKRLSVTVFGGENGLPADEEAERIWHEVVGVPKEAISRKGAADNFWAMGDTGPCGPCTEIHYDRSDAPNAFGGDDAEGDKVLEIWNLVFMQYEKKSDGSLIPLPAPCVDTGMGLERLCMVVGGLPSNYDTDLLKPFIDLTSTLCGKTYQSSDSEDDVSLRVIADHCRTTAFLIADGIMPSNEGRGYVLRRIMRRAIRHGARLGFDKPFFHTICEHVVTIFHATYPELTAAKDLIQKVVLQEEETFRRTLQRGLQLFDNVAKPLSAGSQLDGAVVFRLHETYGFPSDLTETLAKERNLAINWQQFDNAKKRHEEASASSLGLKGVEDIYKELAQKFGKTEFTGYSTVAEKGCRILALLQNHALADVLSPGEVGFAILNKTPFYGESGGQVGDTGFMSNKHTKAAVTDTKKIADLHIHQVVVDVGNLKVGDIVTCEIDEVVRQNTKRHHSVTHLLHSALKEVLGSHVIQKGSLVAPDRLRFDFAHFEPVTPEQLQKIESLVNAWILENRSSTIESLPLDLAKSKGAAALFGEKYGDVVRVVQMGPHSLELCGGTHVEHTGDIGLFKVVSEGPLAAGVRRIEAVAGQVALDFVHSQMEALKQTSQLLGVQPAEVSGRVAALLEEQRNLEKKLEQFKAHAAAQKAQSSLQHARTINGTRVVIEKVEFDDANEMRSYADKVRDQLGSGIVVLGASFGDKCGLLVALTKDLTNQYHAGKIIGRLADVVGGKGGGRPDLAQAGGPLVNKLDEALASVETIL